MGRKIPVWVFLLFLVFFAISLSFYGSLVRSATRNLDESGLLGRLAYYYSGFPKLMEFVFTDLGRQLDDKARYAEVRVPLDVSAKSEMSNVESQTGSRYPGLAIGTGPSQHLDGWRILTGAFIIDDELEHAAILIGPDLSVRKHWILEESDIFNAAVQRKDRKMVHGFAFLEDNSMIFLFTSSTSVQRIDACGKLVWSTRGGFHHSVVPTEDGAAVWVPYLEDYLMDTREDAPKRDYAERYAIAKISVQDGSILDTINFKELIAENPELDILELRQHHIDGIGGNDPSVVGAWMNDPFHVNDADPLPARLAGAFPQFSPGDLLVSARSTNAIFVLDPETRKIRWWRLGATKAQHDPDWVGSGKIRVYNNRMARGSSEIVDIDPDTYGTTVAFDGRRNAFYSRIRGNQQTLPNGGLLVSSAQQARAFEVDAEGRNALEILNEDTTLPGTGLALTDALWLPLDAVHEEIFECD